MLPNDAKLVMRNAVKCRSARKSKFHKFEIGTILPGVAALGLGLITSAPSLAVIGGGIVSSGVVAMIIEKTTDFKDYLKKCSIMHKYNKLANSITNSMKQGDPNCGLSLKTNVIPATGDIYFSINYNGRQVEVVDHNFDGNVTVPTPSGPRTYNFSRLKSVLNDNLDMNFEYMNDDKKRKASRYYDKYNIPKVTIDTLEAPYVEYGGVPRK